MDARKKIVFKLRKDFPSCLHQFDRYVLTHIFKYLSLGVVLKMRLVSQHINTFITATNNMNYLWRPFLSSHYVLGMLDDELLYPRVMEHLMDIYTNKYKKSMQAMMLKNRKILEQVYDNITQISHAKHEFFCKGTPFGPEKLEELKLSYQIGMRDHINNIMLNMTINSAIPVTDKIAKNDEYIDKVIHDLHYPTTHVPPYPKTRSHPDIVKNDTGLYLDGPKFDPETLGYHYYLNHCRVMGIDERWYDVGYTKRQEFVNLAIKEKNQWLADKNATASPIDVIRRFSSQIECIKGMVALSSLYDANAIEEINLDNIKIVSAQVVSKRRNK